MTGFRIIVNGKTFCESEDLTALTMVVEDLRNRDEPRVSLHARAGEGPVQWLAANLRVGDTVTIEVVDLVAEAESESEMSCRFCGCGFHEVASLIKGPTVAICDRCTVAFSEAVRMCGQLPTGAAFRPEPEWSCGFCGKLAADVAGVIVRNQAAICPECLRTCHDLLEGGSRDEPSDDA
jgi:hypothetical protein